MNPRPLDQTAVLQPLLLKTTHESSSLALLNFLASPIQLHVVTLRIFYRIELGWPSTYHTTIIPGTA